ncbi:MAG TPA: AraC family transcriptional regulator [Candidatus Saccharimonadia bacterium]|nr:AraC family transcriptional regulator [Candidatus Saccharimonadia bacterium]
MWTRSFAVICVVYTSISKETTCSFYGDPDNIQGLVDDVEENLSDEINIVDLAASYDLSPWHFQRLFKALVGDTLGGYIRGRRLTEAAHLLLSTDLGIIDIAFGVGFRSHEAFTRAFKEYFGQSPKDFRKNKPSVVLNEKPLLSMELVQHLEKEIQHVPVIKTTPELTVIGLETLIPSPFISEDAYCESLYPSWMSLLKRQDEIQDRLPAMFYGITASPSGNFIKNTLNFIAGVPVASYKFVPGGMVAWNFPEQLVAMFKVASIEKETVLKTIDYIYGYWLPNSPYTRGSGSDYELFGETNGFIDPHLGSNYVIPIMYRSPQR